MAMRPRVDGSANLTGASTVCNLQYVRYCMPMKDVAQDLLKGTLDMLILKALELAPMHGWGIGERIAQLSRDVFHVQTGTLYPALQRLLRQGLVVAEWRTSDNSRRARYYRLTASGRKKLDAERASWERASLAVKRILSADA
jgi:PadR family transcriptional regulator PadR